jgi:hypothetical protein
VPEVNRWVDGNRQSSWLGNRLDVLRIQLREEADVEGVDELGHQSELGLMVECQREGLVECGCRHWKSLVVDLDLRCTSGILMISQVF